MYNKSILKTANIAIINGDYEVFLSHCTDDTIWNFIGDKTLNGKESVRNILKIGT
nr:hypothetical protein [uncultured Flavobacterium sp.]